jgi:hypothetical protein
MMDRGGCMFVTKIQNCQLTGAKACLIINSEQGGNLPFMQDMADDDDDKLDVPAAMIHQSDGAILKDLLCGAPLDQNQRGSRFHCKAVAGGGPGTYSRRALVVRLGSTSVEAAQADTLSAEAATSAADADEQRLDGDSATKAAVQLYDGLTGRTAADRSKGTTVRWDFWTSSDDAFSANLKDSFPDLVNMLGEAVHFTPHYVTTSGADIGCWPLPAASKATQADRDRCLARCTNAGRYCAPHWPVTSSFVVAENVRQICVFRVGQNAVKDKGPGMQWMGALPWWNYVRIFSEKCGLTQYALYSAVSWRNPCVSDAALRADILAKSGLDPQEVEQCVAKAGGSDVHADNKNTLLEEELALQLAQGAFMLPSLFVNGEVFRGGLSCGRSAGNAPYAISQQDQEAGLKFNYRRCGLLGALCAALSANAPLAARATCQLGPKTAVAGRSWSAPTAQDNAVGITLKVSGQRLRSRRLTAQQH